MPRVKDIRIAKNGTLHSLVGQKMQAGGELRILKGGTILRHDGQLYVYSEDLNARVGVSVAGDGTQIGISFRSLPSAPFRPSGEYRIAGETMNVRVRLTGQLRLTDGSDEAYEYSAGPFACDGQEHSVLDGTSVPSGKEAFRADIDAAQILFSSGGMDAYAYAQGEVEIESAPRRFTAAAYVSPAGAGTATAEPANPAYGQLVTFLATDGNGYKFTRWASGRSSRSYAVQAFGDLSDTAVFESTAHVVDFAFTLSFDAGGHLQVVGKSLQNKTDEFVMVAFDIKYLDPAGAGQTTRYEREIYLNGQEDTYVFADTDVSQILEFTTPEFTGMPAPYVTGDVQVIIAGAYTSQSLDEGPGDAG